jgi:hypothetical protein
MVGATVSMVVVFAEVPVPAKDDELTTPPASTVAITVPSIALALLRVKRYGPDPEPLVRVLVQVPEPPLVPAIVTSSMPKPVTGCEKETE